MNLILVGYRGTGKSTVARKLAVALAIPAVSLDDELVRRARMSIPEIVAAKGWEHFRDLEQALVAELTKTTGCILDCGGGVIERSVNLVALRSSGTVFWLTAGTQKIVERISAGTQPRDLDSPHLARPAD